MSKFLSAATMVATVLLGAAASQAAVVAMYGEYAESNGIIVNIPQNPPIVPCTPPPLLAAPPNNPNLNVRPTGVNDARCHLRRQALQKGTAVPTIATKFEGPQVGNKGARNITVPGTVMQALAVGAPFTIPSFAFEQQLGPQIGIVLENVVRQLDTTFIAAMPGIDRIGPNPGPINGAVGGSYTIKTPGQRIAAPTLTRMFSAANYANAGNGQNNGVPAPNFEQRTQADPPVITNSFAGEDLQMRYASGPNDFGGTMALLLDGRGRLYLFGPPISGGFIAAGKLSLLPVVGTNPVGDNDPGFRVRNGQGWNITASGMQAAGRIKAFAAGLGLPQVSAMGAPIIANGCIGTTVNATCNQINGFETQGFVVAALPAAQSFKHAFAWTTGRVSIVRTGLRRGVQQTDTVTGKGYDTVGLSSMGGPQRNVGLVAGSYTRRTAASGNELNHQLVGINLKFTPEPGATVALVSGLGTLAFLAYRRRSA